MSAQLGDGEVVADMSWSGGDAGRRMEVGELEVVELSFTHASSRGAAQSAVP